MKTIRISCMAPAKIEPIRFNISYALPAPRMLPLDYAARIYRVTCGQPIVGDFDQVSAWEAIGWIEAGTFEAWLDVNRIEAI